MCFSASCPRVLCGVDCGVFLPPVIATFTQPSGDLANLLEPDEFDFESKRNFCR